MKVPNDLMIPIGAKATAAFKSCADNWSDSQIAELRTELPIMYHAEPLDSLRRQFINLRKRHIPGFQVNGHGPAKGSRRRSSLPPVPVQYKAYLESDSWKSRTMEWLRFWEHRCCICNIHRSESELNVHHRTYERIGHERQTDCVVLCRSCHHLFHSHNKLLEDATQELFV